MRDYHRADVVLIDEGVPQSGGEGKRVCSGVDLGGRRIIKKKKSAGRRAEVNKIRAK
jgi:hypothetical protein